MGGILSSFALGLVFAGVSALLFAPPKSQGPSERPENKPNTYFNGPVNTIAQGHPVPIGYGELIVGSAVISAGLETVNI
jgi:predicted phage tail protein